MMHYNRNFAKLKPDGTLEFCPIPLTVVTHHHEEWDETVLDPETGEPTGETEHKSRDWDTSERKLKPSAAECRQMGYLRAVDEVPEVPPAEGWHYEPQGWEEQDGAIRRVYAEVQDPPPRPRRWSSLAIKRTFEARGSWAEVKGLLESLGLYDDFLMADYVAEDDDAFKTVRDEAVRLYGEKTVAEILDTIPQEVG